MRPSDWLNPALVLARPQTADARELIALVTERMATVTGLDPERIGRVLSVALALEGWSLGAGVGVPHGELEGLTEPRVCLVVTASPVELPSIDARPPDIFFFILAPPDDPQDHLLLLAHLARLAQSRTLLEGLRKAATSEEMIALVRAAERRHVPAAPLPDAGAVLIVISIAGEKAVDALLVELLDRGLDQATIVEAQSVREATTREVPLFSGFHDIFGDPGGRRVIFLDAPTTESAAIFETAKRVAGEHRAKELRISVLPLELHWHLSPPAEDEGGGHA
jgi:mannitol/fructose-specific phosphotransferase system IIA component (Ntr-type)